MPLKNQLQGTCYMLRNSLVARCPAVGPCRFFYVNKLGVYQEKLLKRPILLVWEGRLEAGAPEPESTDHTAHPPLSRWCSRIPAAGRLPAICYRGAYRNGLDAPRRYVKLNLGVGDDFISEFCCRADGVFLARFRRRRFSETNFQFHGSRH